MSRRESASGTSSGNEELSAEGAGVLSTKGEHVLLRIKLKPRSSRMRVEKVEGDHLVVAVNAPAVGGQANRALVELLAKETARPKSSFEIIRGETSRLKTVRVSGITREELGRRLGVLPPSV